MNKSWAKAFNEHIFFKINEEIFSVLYIDKASRPNHLLISFSTGEDLIKADEVEALAEIIAKYLAVDNTKVRLDSLMVS